MASVDRSLGPSRALRESRRPGIFVQCMGVNKASVGGIRTPKGLSVSVRIAFLHFYFRSFIVRAEIVSKKWQVSARITSQLCFWGLNALVAKEVLIFFVILPILNQEQLKLYKTAPLKLTQNATYLCQEFTYYCRYHRLYNVSLVSFKRWGLNLCRYLELFMFSLF